MARPSLLTERQKAEVQRRLASGETQRALAKEFGVSNGTIASLFVGRSETIKSIAKATFELESRTALLSIPEQVIIRTMADQMKDMQQDYTRGAALGLDTANRLHQIANIKAKGLDPNTVETEDLRLVAALTETGNKASAMGTTILNANKDANKDTGKVTLQDLIRQSNQL